MERGQAVANDTTDNTTLVDVHEERPQVPSESAELPEATTGTLQLQHEFDVAAMRYSCQANDQGYTLLAAADFETLLRDVMNTRQQLQLSDDPMVRAIARQLCANPSVCTVYGALRLLTSDRHVHRPNHFSDVLNELALIGSNSPAMDVPL